MLPRSLLLRCLFLLLTGLHLCAQYSLGELKGSGSVTQGKAGTIVQTNFLPGCSGSRTSGMGKIVSTDGKEWIVPAENMFLTGAKASDLYNDCSGVRLANISALNLAKVPIVDIDPDGEIITGYLFGDNYFELYINAKLVAVDPVPYTPFNSSVVRFRVKRPYTIAVTLIDWEENLGIGTENNQGNAYYAGDGGFIASFSDGTVTDASWKAQTYYIAPLADPSLVEEKPDGTRSTAGASTNPSCTNTCYAVHYPVPDGWNSPSFNDEFFPSATLYTEQTVGVQNKLAYTNFIQQFSGAGARFIWSSNLVLDNLVLLRKTVGSTTGTEHDNTTNTPLAFSFSPHPVQNSMKIEYTLCTEQTIRLDILDMLGNIVATPVQGFSSAGRQQVLWDGKGYYQQELPQGIYMLRLQGRSLYQLQPFLLLP